MNAKWKMAGIGNCHAIMPISMTSKLRCWRLSRRKLVIKANQGRCLSCPDLWPMSQMQYQTGDGKVLTNTSARSSLCRRIFRSASSYDNCLRHGLAILRLTQTLWETITAYRARRSSRRKTKHPTLHRGNHRTAKLMAAGAMVACIHQATPLTNEDPRFRRWGGPSCGTKQAR